MSLEKLVNYVIDHGFQCKIVDNQIFVLELSRKDGIDSLEWIVLPSNLTKIRIWLGY